MITFEDIKRANKTIKTTPIQGKDYAEVNQRIKAFRMLFPEGFITTEIKSLENGVVIFQATVGYYDENGNAVVLGTGTAYEKENSTFINKTSYLENAETSSVGRALGMAGFGIDTSIASAEEVQNARLNQANQETASRKAKTASTQAPVSEQTPAVELITDLNEKASDEIVKLHNAFVFDLHGNVKTVLMSKKLKDVNLLSVDDWKKVIAIQQAWIDKKKKEAQAQQEAN